jgi:hypothetical protein
MTATEAYDWVISGGKVRHATWSMDTYAFLHHGVVSYTDGTYLTTCPPFEFFSNNWQIYTK